MLPPAGVSVLSRLFQVWRRENLILMANFIFLQTSMVLNLEEKPAGRKSRFTWGRAVPLAWVASPALKEQTCPGSPWRPCRSPSPSPHPGSLPSSLWKSKLDTASKEWEIDQFTSMLQACCHLWQFSYERAVVSKTKNTDFVKWKTCGTTRWETSWECRWAAAWRERVAEES